MRLIAIAIFMFYVQLGVAQQTNPRQAIVDSLLIQVETIPDDFEKIRLLTSNAGKMRYTLETKGLIDRALFLLKRQR